MTETTTYRLVMQATAKKSLRAVPKKDAARLITALQQVAADPFASHSFAKKLQGEDGYRVRKGDWRAVYEIDRAAKTVRVLKIAKRARVYR